MWSTLKSLAKIHQKFSLKTLTYFFLVSAGFMFISLYFISLHGYNSIAIIPRRSFQQSSFLNVETVIGESNVNEHVLEHRFHFSLPEKKKPLPTPEKRKIEKLAIDTSLPRIMNGSFVPKPYLYTKEAYENYKRYVNQKEELLPEQTKAVIVLTNYRSGSSFFGQLLNQHPDVFYFFEPLYPISFSDVCGGIEHKNPLLLELVKCKLPNYKEIFSKIAPEKRITKTVHLKNCMTRGVCFRDGTKDLCAERHCPPSPAQRPGDCYANCGVINTILASNDCRKKKLVAMKIIRYCNILNLKEVFVNTNVDIKVLHLIRDPRGIASSRKLLHRKLNLKESLQKTCKRQAHNVYSAAVTTPDWLKGRYKVFRYEDVASSPFESAKAIYDFIGLDFPDTMKTWISVNTDVQYFPNLIDSDSGNTTGMLAEEDKERRKSDLQNIQNIIEFEKTKRQKRGPYGTTRNSTATMQKWVKRLPYSVVKEIESVCKPIMNLVGYKPVTSVEEFNKKDQDVRYFTDEIDFSKFVS